MSDAVQLWSEIVPDVRKGVTGVGVWAAVNACRPVALEDNVLVLGLPYEVSDLGGHLKIPSTKRLIETMASNFAGRPIAVRIIEGISQGDWESVKRKDAEAQRLQEKAMQKMRAELAAKTTWESVYEQLGRRYAAVPNKSLPQNRARFFEEAVELIAETRRSQESWDDLGERNFARCLERLSQYSELPSTMVARHVLKRAGEL